MTHASLFTAALLAASTGLAHATGAPEERAAAYLSATCANCHGTAGRTVGSLPPLAGMPRDGLERAMAEFRSGQRPATVMHQIAKGFSEPQIEQIAAYFAAQSK